MKAIIMAGGKGTRLQPFTNTIPKPLLPVGRKPIMQIIIEQLSATGFTDIAVTTEYQSELIKAYFKDGTQFGVSMHYYLEEKPLGTAGGLGLLRDWLIAPAILINGDILTRTKFNLLYQFHTEQSGTMLTIGIRNQPIPIPYGVVEMKDGQLLKLAEKPTLTFPILAGIYAINPEVLTYISGENRVDITDVIQLLINDGKKVSLYPITEYWRDIGSIEDLTKVIDEENDWQ